MFDQDFINRLSEIIYWATSRTAPKMTITECGDLRIQWSGEEPGMQVVLDCMEESVDLTKTVITWPASTDSQIGETVAIISLG